MKLVTKLLSFLFVASLAATISYAQPRGISMDTGAMIIKDMDMLHSDSFWYNPVTVLLGSDLTLVGINNAIGTAVLAGVDSAGNVTGTNSSGSAGDTISISGLPITCKVDFQWVVIDGELCLTYTSNIMSMSRKSTIFTKIKIAALPSITFNPYSPVMPSNAVAPAFTPEQVAAILVAITSTNWYPHGPNLVLDSFNVETTIGVWDPNTVTYTLRDTMTTYYYWKNQ